MSKSKKSQTFTNFLNGHSNDVVFTPPLLAKKCIELIDIQENETVLDSSAGENKVFYNNINVPNKSYCEILEGKDFFLETQKYDVIISNPPFSQIRKNGGWIEHTLKLCNKRCGFILGCMNLTPKRIQLLDSNGWKITKIYYFRVRWWFSNSIFVVAEKNPINFINTQILYDVDEYLCDICLESHGGKCQRGRKPIGANQCSHSK